MFVSGSGREECGWSPPFHCCPVNPQHSDLAAEKLAEILKLLKERSDFPETKGCMISDWCQYYSSRYLLVQIQQWKHQNSK